MPRLSRRSLFGLGAGAVAAAVVPVPVQAAPASVGLAPLPTFIRGPLGPEWFAFALKLGDGLGAAVSPDVAETMTQMVGRHAIEHMLQEGRIARGCRRDECGALFGLPAAPPPPMPDWLADTPAWLVPYLERLAVAIPKVNVRDKTEGRRTPEEFAEAAATVAELASDPNRESFMTVYKSLNTSAVASADASRVSDRRIATARIWKLTPNERRRVRRWIARQPIGADQPLIRLRLGRRNDPVLGFRDFDFIDVARPAQGPGSSVGAYMSVDIVLHKIGRDLWMPIPYTPMCSHYHQGVRNHMATKADGRLAY